MHKVFLGLGSNLGDREKNINDAVKKLDEQKDLSVIILSAIVESEPENKGSDPLYLNCVVKIITSLTAHELLIVLEDIEIDIGRLIKGDYSPRLIDIDILLFDEEVILETDLTIPHPLMHERLFVMVPLAEIAPEAFHPILQKNARILLADLLGKNA